MNKEDLEKLIADQPKEIRAKGVLLFNGAAQAAKAYQDASTAANLRDWEAAQAALAKFAEQVSDGPDAGRVLSTIVDVLDYLKETGWKVTRTSLYRHQKQGKFLPRRDGSYLQKDINKYALAFLREQSTGKRVSEAADALQTKRYEKENRNLDLDYDRKKFAFEKELGQYIPKEQMDIELASRAGILNAGLKHWVQSHAADWIRASGGDTKRVGELINIMSRDLDEHINNYASTLEYQVVIDAPEEAEPENGEEPTKNDG